MSDGGTLTLITTGIRRLGANGRREPETYLRLSVKDTGPGFDPALARRLHEPFFMKRRLGWGSGLEFAVVDAVVENHQGFMEIETAPGQGATFHLHFPCGPSLAVRRGRRKEPSRR
jgi:signal transduction histidine kinase